MEFKGKCPVCGGPMAIDNKYCRLECYKIENREVVIEKQEPVRSWEER